MADTTQEQLLRLFEEAAGSQGNADALGAEAYSLSGADSSAGAGDTAPKGDPNPITPNSTPTGNTGITAESVATTVLESGFGIVPLVAGIIGLFEGGKPAPPVFTKYAMPDSIQFEGNSSGGDTGIDDFDQMGMPRAEVSPDGAFAQSDAVQGTTTTHAAATPGTGQSQATPSTAQPGDPQWFMDHSSDIARAVRSAMLNLSSVNDVVSDL
jgi:hypothetical protein